MGKENRMSSVRLRFQPPERARKTKGSLNSMQRSRERLLEFLFPAGTDHWLAVLRVGLGFQVAFYSLSLRNDWNNLLLGTASNLAEALLSLDSHFVPRLGWLVAIATQVGLRQETVLLLRVALFTCFRLRPSPGICVSLLCDCGLASSPLRGEERRIRVLRR